MKSKLKKIGKYLLLVLGVLLIGVLLWQGMKRPPTEGDWQEQLRISSTAQFNGDLVTVRNVRNFRYYPRESDMHPGYYDRTYNLNDIKRVWYVTEPFNENKLAAHTFLSFEFENEVFLAITIEARKTKSQTYSTVKGFFRTYPLVYIAADERDVMLVRANIRKDKVYAYPVKLSKPENARLLLIDVLKRMNDLQVNPEWYNTFWANCTSSIAYHVNRLDPGRVSMLSWQLWLTASADELAHKRGLLDTELPIEQAREKYLITEKSLKIGDTPDYSVRVREQ